MTREEKLNELHLEELRLMGNLEILQATISAIESIDGKSADAPIVKRRGRPPGSKSRKQAPVPEVAHVV